MVFSIILLSILIFLKTLGYAVFEYKENKNKKAGIIIAVLAIICLIVPGVVTVI